MQFDDYNLNRRLYRKDSKYEDTDPTSGLQYAGGTEGGQGTINYPPATAVEPGTVVQSIILQSSGSNNRVEITPNDNLTVYDNGDIRTQINSQGLSTYRLGNLIWRADEDGMRVLNIGTGDPIVDIDTDLGFMIYDFDIMPVVYGGFYDDPTNTATQLPPGWLAVPIIGGGGLIDILFIHNLNADVQVTVTPISVHARPMIQGSFPTFFIVSMQISIYGSQSFPVSGGGSVNVSGIYQGEDNTFMTSFYFTATRYIV